jgi:AcrR family transcriptional regulator
MSGMTERDFDQALIAAAFRIAGESGWARLTIADAARSAGLPLGEARLRFPGKHALLRRFGRLLDEAALSNPSSEGPTRDQLFDLLMSRFEAMKPHREGVRALMRYLPTDPATALQLACATRLSMRWLLQAAGQTTHGVRGALRVKGLVAVWLCTLRRFEADESEDLSATMVALDTSLRRAHRIASWISRSSPSVDEADESAVSDAAPEPT